MFDVLGMIMGWQLIVFKEHIEMHEMKSMTRYGLQYCEQERQSQTQTGGKVKQKKSYLKLLKNKCFVFFVHTTPAVLIRVKKLLQ